MTTATAPDFRLFTAEQIAQLSNETMLAHMSEMEGDRVGNDGTDDWYLRPIHEAYALYEDEACQRREAGDTFWPEPAKRVLIALEDDGDDLPF